MVNPSMGVSPPPVSGCDTPDRPHHISASQKCSSFRRIGEMKRTIAALLVAAVLGCSANEGEPVTLTKMPALMAAGVPPIDAAAPSKIETATFAVG